MDETRGWVPRLTKGKRYKTRLPFYQAMDFGIFNKIMQEKITLNRINKNNILTLSVHDNPLIE
jgi:4-alpha-glucanotransferase